MNNFEEFNNFLDNKIEEIEKRYGALVNDRGQDLNSLSIRLEQIKNVLEGLKKRRDIRNIDDIVNDDIFDGELADIIHEYMPTVNNVKELYNYILRISKMETEDPQVVISKETVNSFIKRFESYVLDYEKKISELKALIDSKKADASYEYRKVRDMINRGGFLKEDELNMVIDFINNLDINDSLKLEFIVNVSIANAKLREVFINSNVNIEDALIVTAIQENLQKAYADKELPATFLSDTSTKEDILEDVPEKEEGEKDVTSVILNKRRSRDLKKIKKLKRKLESIYGDDEYLPLYEEALKDSDLSLASRVNIYDSNGSSKWAIIYVDLCNLLEMEYTEDNVQEIFDIYRHIWEEYNVYRNQKENENKIKNSRQGMISSVNLNSNERSNYMKKIEEAEAIYDTCSNESTNDEDYWAMVSLLGDSISSFKKLYKDYNAAYELATKPDISEESFALVKEEIGAIVKKLREAYPKLNKEVEHFKVEIKNFNKPDDTIGPNGTDVIDISGDKGLSSGKNLVIFLPYRGELCGTILKDQKEIMDTDRKCFGDLVTGLKSFYDKAYILENTKRDHKLLPSKKGSSIPNYSEEVSPRTYRNRDIRFAYSYVSMSQNNKELLKKHYGNDNDIKIVLLIGTKIKHENSREVGSSFNSRIASSIDDIRDINKLFYSDFTPEGFEQAKALIDESYKIISDLGKDPTRSTDRREAR